MIEVLSTLRLFARGAWRFRWHGVIAAWAVALLGWVGVCVIPATYEARARVYVDTDTVLRPLLTGLAVNSDVMSQVSMMSTVLLGRPNLERVAREADLLLRAQSEVEQEELIQSLRRRIVLEGSRDNVYTLGFRDSSPQTAQNVVQTLVDTFIEDTLDTNRADATNAQRFLQDEIADYEARLRTSEERLAEFKQKNLGLMPGEGGDYYTRLQNAMATAATLRDQLRIASQRRDELAKQLEGESPTFGLVLPRQSGGAPQTAQERQVAELQKRLDDMLLQYTDKHPDVIATREKIAQLQAQDRADTGAAPSGPVDSQTLALSQLDINPVYQNMRIALSKTEVELVETRSKIAQAEAEVAQMRRLVDTIPQVEAQLARLNRDYEVTKAQHTALLQRLESARLSEKADQSNEEVKFRVIEPPRLPLKPVAPARPLFFTVVLMFSLMVGAATAVLLHQVNPIFATKRMLEEITRLPVLGSVSLSPSAATTAALVRQPLLVGGAVGLLVIAYVLGLLLLDVLAPTVQAGAG